MNGRRHLVGVSLDGRAAFASDRPSLAPTISPSKSTSCTRQPDKAVVVDLLGSIRADTDGKTAGGSSTEGTVDVRRPTSRQECLFALERSDLDPTRTNYNQVRLTGKGRW